MNKIEVKSGEQYNLSIDGDSFAVVYADTLRSAIRHYATIIPSKGGNNIPSKEGNKPLKDIYVSLSRAIEDGNELKLGIVIGQVLSKLETLINE